MAGGWGDYVHMSARPTKPNAPHDALCRQLKMVGLEGWTREYRAIPGRRYRIDIAFPEQRIAVEVMGGTWANGRHNRGAGYATDCEKACLLAGMGWSYLPVTTEQVHSGLALEWIEQTLKARKSA